MHGNTDMPPIRLRLVNESMAGRNCPSNSPSEATAATDSVFEIMPLKYSGAKGTRTSGLLHAMRLWSVDPSPAQSNGEPPTCTNNPRQSGTV
jgi:hypothetical protein